MNRNNDLREVIRNSKVYNYEIAEALNIHENTFYRMLRKPLSEAQKQEILNIVKELSIKRN